jgi:integrase
MHSSERDELITHRSVQPCPRRCEDSTMTDLINDHLQWLRAGGRWSDATISAREGCCNRADRALPKGLDEVSQHDIIQWTGSKHWRANTRFIVDWHLRGYFEWAVAADKLDFNPMDGIPVPRPTRRRPRPVSDEQLAAILAEVPEPYFTFALIAADAGLRTGEIAGLDRDDVHENWIIVRHGKGDKDRKAYSTRRVWERVRHFPAGPVAVAAGGRADAEWIRKRTHRPLTRAAGENCGLHRLRAWNATAWRRAGADVYLIRDQLGHASITSTERYVDTWDEERLLVGSTLPIVAAAR